jgi:hypothetical protein
MVAVRYKDWSKDLPVTREKEFKSERAFQGWLARVTERGNVEVLATSCERS